MIEQVSERIKRMVEKKNNIEKNIFIHIFGVDASLVFFVFELMRWFCAMAGSMYAHKRSLYPMPIKYRHDIQ